MKKRIILVGKGASGKDFFREYLHKNYEKVDVSYTTREPRKGEILGYTYIYISKEDFEEMASKDELYENVFFNNNYYGTSRESWNNNHVFIMTPSGVKHITEEDRKDCTIVFFDIDEETRKSRLQKRSDSHNTMRRLQADKDDFEGFKDFDIRVTNPEFNPYWLKNVVMLKNLI